MDMDLILNMVGPPFSCFNALPAKIARKILCSVFPDKICLKSPSNR